MKQVYLDGTYYPRFIHVPQDLDDREVLAEVFSESAGHKVEIVAPQRGPKHAFMELVEKNAKHSFLQRFRVLRPTSEAIGEALQNALGLPVVPTRIESFDISHMQGTDTVASMVVWESGRMKKSDYRKFIIRGMATSRAGSKEPIPALQSAALPILDGDLAAQAAPAGAAPADTHPQEDPQPRLSPPDNALLRDDFASMKEVVTRRYRRLVEEDKPLPSLILIDGGIGQLHAAAAALEGLEIINQPVASIAKQEEILYVLGREDEPCILDRHSPILHLIQQIRDETHRFAVTFHRQRRSGRQLRTELLEIPGIGEHTAVKLLRHFGSVTRLREHSVDELAKVATRAQARRVYEYLHQGRSEP